MSLFDIICIINIGSICCKAVWVEEMINAKPVSSHHEIIMLGPLKAARYTKDTGCFERGQQSLF